MILHLGMGSSSTMNSMRPQGKKALKTSMTATLLFRKRMTFRLLSKCVPHSETEKNAISPYLALSGTIWTPSQKGLQYNHRSIHPSIVPIEMAIEIGVHPGIWDKAIGSMDPGLTHGALSI